jgi:hypothetical protein
MKTKISVTDALRLNACDSGLALGIELSATAGISADSEIDFDILFDMASTCRATSLCDFLLTNKAGLLNYTNEQFDCYIINGQKFHSAKDAILASNSLRNSRVDFYKNLTSVVFSESLGEDSTWISVDIDIFNVPDNVIEFHFHVFNTMTGLHEECATIEDAKSKRDKIIQECLASESNSFKIFSRYVYAEDGITDMLRETSVLDMCMRKMV